MFESRFRWNLCCINKKDHKFIWNWLNPKVNAKINIKLFFQVNVYIPDMLEDPPGI
jgi:hypothetical protein